jgi:hypothetical protein
VTCMQLSSLIRISQNESSSQEIVIHTIGITTLTTPTALSILESMRVKTISLLG